ncbi:unnamed protein product [Medioppia subpectinata]|uniref:C2H2-type domain-containing protein n=1 Tax=Medioppia subpectinata TaxID=1979941 RepID=A0A7R9KUC3_9ACAR|nr:unnamed protein product [Medioppia subpectinata]CAG2110034.1 unnamed protein product [Medioppia subpectinata]
MDRYYMSSDSDSDLEVNDVLTDNSGQLVDTLTKHSLPTTSHKETSVRTKRGRPLRPTIGHKSKRPQYNISDTSNDENDGHEESDSRPTQAINREGRDPNQSDHPLWLTNGRKSGRKQYNISDTSSYEESGHQSTASRPIRVSADGIREDSCHACDVCGKAFVWKCDLDAHRTAVHQIGNYRLFPCDRCQHCFTTETDLSAHKWTKHKPLTTLVEPNGQRTRRSDFECKDCGKRFKSAEGVGRHRELVHSVLPMSIKTDGCVESTQKEIKKHTQCLDSGCDDRFRTATDAYICRSETIYQFECVDRESEREGWALAVHRTSAGLFSFDTYLYNFQTHVHNDYPLGPNYMAVVDTPWVLKATALLVMSFMDQHLKNAVVLSVEMS